MSRSASIYTFCISIGVCLMVLSSFGNKHQAGSPDAMKMKVKWVKEHFLDTKSQPPFSFIYDERKSSGLLGSWSKKAETAKLDKNRTRHHLIWTDVSTGLEVRCEAIEYADYPVVEWTVYLKNTGKGNTPVLKDIQGLDAAFHRGNGSEFILNGNKGDFCTADSYEPYKIILGPNITESFAPSSSGKSCDGPKGWPYYNLQVPDGGLIIAVGWPGQWASSFTRDGSDGLTVRAGQQLTNLYLKPGEEIRTPLIIMLFWQGTDVVAAQNLWRHYYMAHVIPRIDGQPQMPEMQIQVGGSKKDLAYVNKFLEAGIKPDICWRDANWYPKDKGPYKGNDAWLNTGTWEIDSTRYPEGFRPFSDSVHAQGMKFLLWFEPERVGDPGSWLSRNHPEWLLPGSSHGTIFNEGNPAALNWLINHIDSMIKSQGIDWYREDMNGVGPMPAWRKNDPEDRQGITENFYVQGHLALWDELKRRNPQLRIDACASGGRRNDIETMRRAVPLLRSDFQWPSMNDVVVGNQGQTYGLSFWFPFQGTGVYFYDSYSFRSFYLPGFGMGGLTPENTAAQQQAYSECRKVAPAMLLGDYYPLTPYNRQHDQWIAWQFNRPGDGDGIIQAFRRDSCNEATMTFHLNGLDPEAQYQVTDFDKKDPERMAGKELMQKGLTVKIENKPGAAIIAYSKIK